MFCELRANADTLRPIPTGTDFHEQIAEAVTTNLTHSIGRRERASQSEPSTAPTAHTLSGASIRCCLTGWRVPTSQRCARFAQPLLI